MTAEKKRQREDLAAKDDQIDVLIAQQDRLLTELTDVAARLKAVLSAGQSDLDAQKDIKRGRRA
jgi:hypothetical protein